MKVPYYKGQKCTRPFFRKNSGSLINHENVLKNGLFWGFLTLSQFWWKSSAGLVIFDCWIWKFGLSVNSQRKPHVREESGWFLRKNFVRRVGCRSPPGVELAIFSSLVHPVNLILHILIKFNGLINLDTIWIMLDHSKITKMHFWMIQRATKEVFGHFLEFGLLDWLDIAYCDSTKCFPT